MFSTLTAPAGERRRRSLTFICGLLTQTLLVGTAAVVAILFPGQIPLIGKHYVTVWLPPLTPPPAPPVLKPPPPMARVVLPKLPPPEPPKIAPPVVANVEVPKVQRPVAPAPVTVAEVPVLPTPKPAPPAKEPLVVHTKVFGGSPEPVTTRRPVEMVQTGGFGSPEGLPGNAQGDSHGNVPKLGSFGLPEGPGVGNGTGGSHGVQGVVASAGFGSGIAGNGYNRGTGGNGGGKVATGGFAQVTDVAPAEHAHRAVAAPVAAFQPVEILSKPTPVYTEEARRLSIQGEVALSVIFEASGEIRVLGIVKSLGHGLDEAAQQAAMQIRFKPAQRSGQPADFPATLRIEFRLAGQSS